MKKYFKKDQILTTIYPYIKGKEVLDIGCIEHTLENRNKERIWVHDFLREYAEHVTGIDIQKDDIETLKKQGYDVHHKNAETFKFNKKFDIIFAGELIEHLSNPGLFLQQCYNHLMKDGYLILTTPNAFNFRRLTKGCLFLTNDIPANSEHTSWYSPSVIRHLLKRYNFKIETITYANAPNINFNVKSLIINSSCLILGNRLKETMIIIARNESKNLHPLPYS